MTLNHFLLYIWSKAHDSYIWIVDMFVRLSSSLSIYLSICLWTFNRKWKKNSVQEIGAQVLVLGGNKTSNEYLSLSLSFFSLVLPPFPHLPGCAALHWRSWLFWKSWTGNSTLWSSLSRFRYDKASVCFHYVFFFFFAFCVYPQKPFTPGTVETGSGCQGDSLFSENGEARGVGAEMMHAGICWED